MPFDLRAQPHQRISQGFVKLAESKAPRRIWKKGNKCFIETKPEEVKLGKPEKHVIPSDAFESLWRIAEKKMEKTRYYVMHDSDVVVEIDQHQGDLDGLLIISVKLGAAALASFEPPAWFGKEKTEDPRFRAKNLARRGMPKDPELSRILRTQQVQAAT